MIFFPENVHKYDNDYRKDLAELFPHNFSMQPDKNAYTTLKNNQYNLNVLRLI